MSIKGRSFNVAAGAFDNIKLAVFEHNIALADGVAWAALKLSISNLFQRELDIFPVMLQ